MRDSEWLRETYFDYADLVEELWQHYDEDLGRIEVFRFSDKLVEAMNEHGVYDPDDAHGLFWEVRGVLFGKLRDRQGAQPVG